MKINLLVSLIAVLAVFTILSSTGVLASTLNASASIVKISGVDVTSGNLRLFGGDIVPVEIQINSNVDAKDATVSVWISGHRSDEISSKVIHLRPGTYPVFLSMNVPANIDPEEQLSLVVLIDTENAGSNEQSFTFTAQRDSYKPQILDVESDQTVKAGENLAVNVVVKNVGYEELEDLFVTVSIPELGVSKRAYLSNLVSNDTCDDCNKQESTERKVSLTIPSSAKAGVYTMKVEVFNDQASTLVSQKILVVGAEQESRTVAPVTSREMAAGETVSYEILLVNSGNNVAIYEIVPETVSGLTITTDKTVIAIPAGSSDTVQVNVKGNKEGTYNFAVNVNSDGQLVKRVAFDANVTGKTLISGGKNITILTIVLAIVFLVLLVVLVVLLTRKPAKSEELEESYY